MRTLSNEEFEIFEAVLEQFAWVSRPQNGTGLKILFLILSGTYDEYLRLLEKHKQEAVINILMVLL